MNERLRALKARAEAAGRKFEEGKRRLYQADGSPLFAKDVMASELEKLARERNAVLFEVEEEAREIGAGASLERLENADPAELLTDEELERANARRPFALDAAEGLSVEDLQRRLDSVLHGGDRASISPTSSPASAGARRSSSVVGPLRGRPPTASATGPGRNQAIRVARPSTMCSRSCTRPSAARSGRPSSRRPGRSGERPSR